MVLRVEVPEAVAVALFNMHVMVHSGSSASNATSRPYGPKLERPRMESGISLEKWKKVDPDVTTRSIEVVIATMKALAVIAVAVGVLCAELLELCQKRDEPFRSFATRVRGKAEMCGFVAQHLCNCGLTNSVDYTENIIRDVLVAGLYDTEIRCDMLGIEGLIDKPTNEVIALVEKKEMACDANVGSASTSAISSRWEGHLSSPSKNSISPLPDLPELCSANRSNQIPCPQCGKHFAPFSEGSFGFNLKLHKLCKDC